MHVCEMGDERVGEEMRYDIIHRHSGHQITKRRTSKTLMMGMVIYP